MPVLLMREMYSCSQHHTKNVHTTNSIERLNIKIRRIERVIRTFLSRESALRLLDTQFGIDQPRFGFDEYYSGIFHMNNDILISIIVNIRIKSMLV